MVVKKILTVSMENKTEEELVDKMKEFERHLLKERIFIGQIITEKGMFSARLVFDADVGADKVRWVFSADDSEKEYELCLE